MPAATGQTRAVAVLEERLSNLQSDITQIGCNVSTLITGFHDFRNTYVSEHAKVVSRTEAHGETLIDHKKRIEELEKEYKKLLDMITPLIQTNKVVVWIGAVLGMSVLGLIWAIITGQVTLLFK